MPAPPQGPVPLLASLPATLGREPGPAELILLGWSEFDDEHVATVTLPLGDTEPREELAAVRQVVLDGATYAVVVVWITSLSWGGSYDTPWSAADALGRFVGACAARYALDLNDAIAVVDGRWRSVGCTDPSCCPPGGRPIPTPTTDQETAP